MTSKVAALFPKQAMLYPEVLPLDSNSGGSFKTSIFQQLFMKLKSQSPKHPNIEGKLKNTNPNNVTNTCINTPYTKDPENYRP